MLKEVNRLHWSKLKILIKLIDLQIDGWSRLFGLNEANLSLAVSGNLSDEKHWNAVLQIKFLYRTGYIEGTLRGKPSIKIQKILEVSLKTRFEEQLKFSTTNSRESCRCNFKPADIQRLKSNAQGILCVSSKPARPPLSCGYETFLSHYSPGAN